MSVDPATAGAPAAAAPTAGGPAAAAPTAGAPAAGPDGPGSRLDLPRTGIGVDVHPFAGDGRPLALAGLSWPG